MITPTKTVCYAQVEHSKSWHKVIAADNCGLTVEWPEQISATWSYSFFSRVIVKEKVVEQNHQYPWCNKNLNPMNPCDCGDCASVLKFFSNIKSLPL